MAYTVPAKTKEGRRSWIDAVARAVAFTLVNYLGWCTLLLYYVR
jgi:hypothetical protein